MSEKSNGSEINRTFRGPPKEPSDMKPFGGSDFEDWNKMLVEQAANGIWFGDRSKADGDPRIDAVIHGLYGINPKDELEGMLATQAIACHNASMACFQRASNPDQTYEGRKEHLNQANKLSRTFVTLLDALNKHRGKGQQKVTVEHVHVHEGGQAIVGTVQHPGGEKKPKGQPHAIIGSPGTEMRCEDQKRDAVPVSRDEER